MKSEEDPPAGSATNDLENSRSQLIFIAVGLAIILGGLWLLYSAEGPYHPGGETQVQLSDD